MQLNPDGSIVEKLGDFVVVGTNIEGVKVSPSPPELIRYMRETEKAIRESIKIHELKEDPIFRAYRDFFWRIRIDPTKTRPASEALTRRILNGRELPQINSFVDALNIASVETKTPFAAFDANLLAGSLRLRYAEPGEIILPIGHKEPVSMKGKEIVISDGEKLVAVYPHRDSDETKITMSTKDAMILSCGVPGVDFNQIRESLDSCCGTVIRFCGGKREP